ncbi:hypothetical protein SADUNF_Sadunf09G0068800 [Salix dunnii]|uniref:Uncharacterized protein n=1 Tax=Salix dunnii TaxID=1413687 RepID=A0A835MT92_9ROSI|nr:hypothetical protein SADUNF_Sadunf09G0068800 [Salix dunnii]
MGCWSDLKFAPAPSRKLLKPASVLTTIAIVEYADMKLKLGRGNGALASSPLSIYLIFFNTLRSENQKARPYHGRMLVLKRTSSQLQSSTKSRKEEKHRMWYPLAQMAIQLENLVQSIKSKVRALKKSKKPYIKMDKSASVRVEIRSRKARKLIDKTLRAADHPGKRTVS